MVTCPPNQFNWPLGSEFCWSIRSDSSLSGPGPNYWSNSPNNVWIDYSTNPKGDLHLKITNIGGKWYCAEVYSANLMGYGTYITTLKSNPETVIGTDSQTVIGLFYFLQQGDELDIEYARWNIPSNDCLGHFGVFYDTAHSCGSGHFYMNSPNTTNKMVWHSNGNVDFEARDSSNNLICTTSGPCFSQRPCSAWSYIYNGPTASDCASTNYRTKINGPFHINLWLYSGAPTNDGLEKEVVLSNFSFTPEGTTVCPGPMIARIVI